MANRDRAGALRVGDPGDRGVLVDGKWIAGGADRDDVPDVLPRIHEPIGARGPVWDDDTARIRGIVDLHLDQICGAVRRNRDAIVELGSGVLEREEKYERSEERRVGKECRSRWSPYH